MDFKAIKKLKDKNLRKAIKLSKSSKKASKKKF